MIKSSELLRVKNTGKPRIKEIARSIKRECPVAVSLLREAAESNPYLNERNSEDILLPEENLWLLEHLGIDAVLNVRGNHTAAVLDLSKLNRKYSLVRFDPNKAIENEQKEYIREDFFYPTSAIMDGYLSSSPEADEESKRGLAKYLSESYFPEFAAKPSVLTILKKLPELNSANDCGPVCVYVLWVIGQLESGQTYTANYLGDVLKEVC